MNSLCMYVKDATGQKFLFTCATNREGQADGFRKHARWWIRSGYKNSPIDKQPAFPVQIVIEEYQDETK
jgi:hypothetical protein